MSMSRHAVLPLGLAFVMSLACAAAQAQQAVVSPDAKSAQQHAIDLPRVEVHADDWRQYLKAKLAFLLPEADGSRITVTKKTTVVHLDRQPTVVGNNLDHLLLRAPGVLVSQQPAPTQFNLSYRGLGNPQESEYVLVLQDGIPLASDWIGFPPCTPCRWRRACPRWS